MWIWIEGVQLWILHSLCSLKAEVHKGSKQRKTGKTLFPVIIFFKVFNSYKFLHCFCNQNLLFTLEEKPQLKMVIYKWKAFISWSDVVNGSTWYSINGESLEITSRVDPFYWIILTWVKLTYEGCMPCYVKGENIKVLVV